MKNQDNLQRFLFEDTAIRGNLVHLQNAVQHALEHQQLPPMLHEALAELMVASVLLASTLKMQGALILQVQGKGALKLLVVECTSQLNVRATAKWQGEITNDHFIHLLKDGQFVITLDPKDGHQAYQGIVPIEGNSIAEILQNYMQRSEQIETKIWLSYKEGMAAGMLLQKLPAQLEEDEDAWNRITHLANTLTHEELLSLENETLLHRLFHEENVRLFEQQPVHFACSCSRQNVGNMLRMLGREEIEQILAEQNVISVNCDFCNRGYIFDAVDAAELIATEATAMPKSENKH